MITIGYTYYTNKPMFDKLVEHYGKNPNPNVKFIIVDDGSPFNQLTEEDMPEGWSLYRITEDIGFNNEGARNLIMHVAETEWVLLTDLDHWVHPDSMPLVDFIPRVMKQNPNMLWTFNRKFADSGKQKVHCNSFFVRKKFWDSFGGYDETWSGNYGYDNHMGWNSSLRPTQMRTDKTIPACHPFVTLLAEGTAADGSDWTHDKKKANKEYFRANRHLFPFTNERLRFPWKRIT